MADPTVQARHDTEAVILTGADLAGWSVPANQTAKLPLLEAPESIQCWADESTCDTHNDYAKPEVDTQDLAPQEGTPVNRLLGYRWDAQTRRFVQIPFQVDEMFTRYLDNSASGFAFYSGEDQHTTYAYDREGFRFYESDPDNPCIARPANGVADDSGSGAGARHERRARLHGRRRGPAGTAHGAPPARHRGGAPRRPDRTRSTR